MIIIGYPGIGKSTLANGYLMAERPDLAPRGVVDLESFVFNIRPNERRWVETYVRVADYLSDQGYIVLVSSHGDVRDALRGSMQRIVVCHPALELREEWTQKLRTRFLAASDADRERDFAAYTRACENYDEDIKDLSRDGFERIVIENMEYDLHDMLVKFIYGEDGMSCGKEEKK